MSTAREILNKLNEAETIEHKFKEGQVVTCFSPQGPMFHIFAKVIGYAINGDVIVKPVLKLDGSFNLDNISINEDGTKLVKEECLDDASSTLDRKIHLYQDRISNLEELRNEI